MFLIGLNEIRNLLQYMVIIRQISSMFMRKRKL